MGRFIIKEAKEGCNFVLKAANGENIATSQVYAGKSTCMNGIESVKTNSVAAGVEDQTVEGYETLKHPKFEVYEDKAGKIRFRLKARNGQIIAVSQAYTAKASCLNGIESVRKNAPDAEVVEEEQD